jgi:hypothetical protein
MLQKDITVLIQAVAESLNMVILSVCPSVSGFLGSFLHLFLAYFSVTKPYQSSHL